MEGKLQELPKEMEMFLKDGNIEECKKLFSGCDPNAVSWSGSNIFSQVPMPREFAFWVKEQGADINFRDRYGRTPVFEIARRDGDIALLIELGAESAMSLWIMAELIGIRIIKICFIHIVNIFVAGTLFRMNGLMK